MLMNSVIALTFLTASSNNGRLILMCQPKRKSESIMI